MESEFQANFASVDATWKNRTPEATCHKVNDKAKDGSTANKKKDAKDGSTTHKKRGAKDGSTTNKKTGAKDGSVTDEKQMLKMDQPRMEKKIRGKPIILPLELAINSVGNVSRRCTSYILARFESFLQKSPGETLYINGPFGWCNWYHMFMAQCHKLGAKHDDAVLLGLSIEFVLPRLIVKTVSKGTKIIAPSLTPVLKKDSVRHFLCLYLNKVGMAYGLMVTPQTLNCMVTLNSLRCAKFVLEGKAPELKGRLAYPNCMNPYGYFPLHEAAERFSVDMIKLLLFHGASANVRTSGNSVIEGLLPLHVAVENTCLHKYLEDNLLPNQDHLDYVYKLIHLLCLPEMKIFLDTTRLLATKTDNLVDELWNYIKDGKLVQAAVLLLAAQEQICGGHSSKINGNDKRNGFDIIMARIMRHYVSMRLEIGKNGNAWNQQEEKRPLIDCAGLLADIISQAGEALDAYIQSHSEVPHVEVLERVSSILKDYGFFPTGGIDVGNLHPYDCKMEDKELRVTHGDASAATEMPSSCVAKAVRKKVPRGWDPTYERRSFIPYWRSVLMSGCPIKFYPAYTEADPRRMIDHELLRSNSSNSMVKGSSPIPNHNRGFLGRITEQASSHQSRRLFGTAAFTLLKVLKNA